MQSIVSMDLNIIQHLVLKAIRDQIRMKHSRVDIGILCLPTSIQIHFWRWKCNETVRRDNGTHPQRRVSELHTYLSNNTHSDTVQSQHKNIVTQLSRNTTKRRSLVYKHLKNRLQMQAYPQNYTALKGVCWVNKGCVRIAFDPKLCISSVINI